MILNETLNLTLYRDGQNSPVQGGRFSQLERGDSVGGTEYPIIFDRLDGGVGATERLVPNTYPLAINGTTRFGRGWMPAGEQVRLPALPDGAGGRPPGEILSMVEYGDDMLVASGGVLYRISYPWTTWVVEHTVSATEWIQDVMVYNGFPIVGTKLADGTPGKLWVKSAGVWISGTANRQHLKQAYFKIDAGAGPVGAWRLVANDTPTTMKFISTSDPVSLVTDADWGSIAGAGYPVGDGVHPITNIEGAALILFFLTTDGLWHVQEDGRSARIADWSNSIHPTNGKAALFMFGGIYASHGSAGLVRVDVSSLQVQWQEQASGPGAGLPRISPLNGEVTALAGDGEWLVAVQYNGTDSHVSYGRPNEITERLAMAGLVSPQAMNWHGSEATLFNTRVTALQQASIGADARPLLWIGGIENGAPVIHQVSLSANPIEDYLQGGQHRFATESWLYLPRQDFGDDRRRAWATSRKVFTRLEVSGAYLERYVAWIDAYMSTSSGHEPYWDRAIDGEETLWSMIGRLDSGDNINMVPGTTVQSGTSAAIMFRGYGTRDHPFMWSGAKLRGVPLLEQAERRRYRVVVGRARQANRAMSIKDRTAMLQELLAYQWSDPIKLYDHTGITVIVQIEEGMTYEEVYNRRTKDWDTVVTFSCRVVRRPFFWGSGYRWGSDIFWS
jgi:hypothetical protein